LVFSSVFFALKPKLDHGKPPGAEASAPGSGISSSESKAVDAVEAPLPKPW